MPCERAGARAWGVEEDAVELSLERERLFGVELDQMRSAGGEPVQLHSHGGEPVRMAIRSNHDARASGGAYQCGSLSARCRAQIEHAISRLNCKQQRYRLGCFVLNRNFARAKRLCLYGASAAYRECTSEENPGLRSQASLRRAPSTSSHRLKSCTAQLSFGV